MFSLSLKFFFVPERFGVMLAAAIGLGLPKLVAASEPVAASSPAGTDTSLALAVQEAAVKIQSDDGAVRTQAITNLKELVLRKDEAPQAFAGLEDALIRSVGSLVQSEKVEDRREAFHQILVLGELRSTPSIPLLVQHMTFRNPYVDQYEMGPMTYTEPKPKDLPVFGALIKIGREVLEPVAVRALAEDDRLVHEVTAELLMYFEGFKGALDWLDLAAAREQHTQDELDRLTSVKGFVEARR